MTTAQTIAALNAALPTARTRSGAALVSFVIELNLLGQPTGISGSLGAGTLYWWNVTGVNIGAGANRMNDLITTTS